MLFRLFNFLNRKIYFVKNDIKGNEISLVFYIIGVLIILINQTYKNVYMYIGVGFFSIGSLIWFNKIYKKYRNNNLFKVVLYLVTTLSALLSYIYTDLLINYKMQLPSQDFTNTVLVTSTVLYIPMFLGVFSFSILILMLSKSFILNLFLTFMSNLGFYKVIKISFTKEVIGILHMIGVVFVYAISFSSLRLFTIEKNIIIDIAYLLDYKTIDNYPLIPKGEKVVLHSNNVYSIIEFNDNKEKIIRVIELNK